MSNPDPTNIINLETSRIPFKSSNMNLDWSQDFRSWPNTTPGWRNWFHRVTHSYRADWEQYNISQCLNLSLSKMVRNELMLISASFFWSDAISAFLFGHGLMTPTLLDVMMLTGLITSASDKPFCFSKKASYGLEVTHLKPNSIAQIAIFIHLCEAYLGIAPDFNLWRALYHLKGYPSNARCNVVGGAAFSLCQG